MVKSKKAKRSIEDEYQKLTHHEHILKLSDTYIGSTECDKIMMAVYNTESDIIERREVLFPPGLYKIFDEIVVNARDHSVRDKTCKNIEIDIDKVTGRITVYNDGNGLPVVIHKDHGIYVPELIMGNLLTSSNYKEKGKLVGGKNGYGAKLANIYSILFDIDTADKDAGKRYVQKFSNNMYDKSKPIITKIKGKPYTKISFIPDYKRFGMDGMTDDIIALFHKRAYDVAGCTNDKVKVKFNGKVINVKNFNDYIKKFYPESFDLDMNMVFESVDRWDVGVVYDPRMGYQSNTYVNGICTYQGGTHLDSVVDSVVKKLVEIVNRKQKGLTVKPAHVKDQITVYINCAIEDPAFLSQVKEKLTTKASMFGSKFEPTPAFIKKLEKTNIINDIIKLAQLKEMAGLERIGGNKRANLRGIDKLDDAHQAGSRHAKHCRLFLTEGDSAKTFVISGMQIIGRERYGVFPLRGKLLNVREATPKKIKENEEIKNIMQIMGLKPGKKYKSISELRYGGIIILTDQDVDGIHIKGLIMNFIHFFWPSLMKTDGFVQCYTTPIVKMWKKTDTKKKIVNEFYSMSEFDNFVSNTLNNDTSRWNVKYYKGLGTSSPEEAKESFRDFEKHLLTYVWDKTGCNKPIDTLSSNDATESDDDIEMDEGKRAMLLGFDGRQEMRDERKVMIRAYNKDNIIDPGETEITVNDFVHKELSHFAHYNVSRAIPSVIDGLKPSQRKVLYAAFKRRLDKGEIKVSQFAGYVAEHTEYHHGEMSLNGTIINMAQDYIGSNNINLLTPNGAFGTRREGGKDAASPRYIYTQMNKLTPLIFRHEDSVILKKNFEDNMEIEPVNYEPIIPMILVNGANGIGSGFMCKVPSYDPEIIVSNMIRLIDGKSLKSMHPYFSGFKGDIVEVEDKDGKYMSIGIYDIIDNKTVRITELPIGVWIESYLKFLGSCEVDDPKNVTPKKFILSHKNNSGNNMVDITISLAPGVLQKMIKDSSFTTKLKLTSVINTSSMYMIDYDTISVRKFETVNDIMESFYEHRLEIYKKRKEYYMKILENDMLVAYHRKRYISMVNAEQIVMNNRSAENVREQLIKNDFPELSITYNEDDDNRSYNYLIDMAIKSLTKEKMKELQDRYDEKKEKLDMYKNTTIEDLWRGELEELHDAYKTWNKEHVALLNDIEADKKVKKPKKGKKAKNE